MEKRFKEINIMTDRVLFENDAIKAVDRHTNGNGKLDDDISCIS